MKKPLGCWTLFDGEGCSSVVEGPGIGPSTTKTPQNVVKGPSFGPSTTLRAEKSVGSGKGRHRGWKRVGGGRISMGEGKEESVDGVGMGENDFGVGEKGGVGEGKMG
jgi:hypothetical protein